MGFGRIAAGLIAVWWDLGGKGLRVGLHVVGRLAAMSCI